MIRNQRPAVAGRWGLLQNRPESFQKPVSIGIILKNVTSLNTPAYNMMQGARGIYSGLTWHVISLPQINEIRNVPLYDESASPSADDYIIDADYPIETYL